MDAVKKDVGWDRLSSAEYQVEEGEAEPAAAPEGAESLEEGMEPGGTSPKVPNE
jgi:hypothetical protein